MNDRQNLEAYVTLAVSDYATARGTSVRREIVELADSYARSEVEKAVAAVKQDHFKIGERVKFVDQTYTELTGRVAVILPGQGDSRNIFYGNDVLSVQHVKAKRKLTRDEKLEKLLCWKSGRLAGLGILIDLKDETIDDLCAVAQIPTEVNDEA